MWYINFRALNTMRNKLTPSSVHNTTPCDKTRCAMALSFEPSALATKGVKAVEKPIPKDMAINTKLFPSETAASSVVPNCPTMILSTN